jgi:hypothetical protein
MSCREINVLMSFEVLSIHLIFLLYNVNIDTKTKSILVLYLCNAEIIVSEICIAKYINKPGKNLHHSSIRSSIYKSF